MRAGLIPLLLAGLAACVSPAASEPDSPPAPSPMANAAESQPVHLPRGAWQPVPGTRPLSVSARTRVISSAIPAVRRAIQERPLRSQLRDARLPGFVITGEESLRAVVDVLRNVTGLPLVVSPAAETAVLDAGIVFDFQFDQPLGAENVLDLIVRQADDEVRWVLRHEAILFVPKHKALGAKFLRLYDIQTLTFARTDFSGPRIDRLRLLDDLEDDDGRGPFGTVGERISEVTPEEVLDSVQEQVAPGTWQEDGVTIDVSEGFLLVVQTAEVHEQVRKFLRAMGAF